MKKNILLIIMIMSLLAVSMTMYERLTVEGNNKKVEVTLDYYEIEKLANQSDENLSWWLKEFKDLGAVSAAIKEESLESMVKEDKDLEFHLVDKIKEDVNWIDKYDGSFNDYLKKADKFDLVAITRTQDIYEFIMEGLENRYPKDFYKGIVGESNYYIVLDGDESEALYIESQKILDATDEGVENIKTLYSSQLAKLGVGFDKEKINLIKNAGLKVVPRPLNYTKHSENLVEAFKNDMEKHDINPSVLIFGNGEVLGYPDDVNNLEKYMKKNDIKVGLIESGVQREHIEQDGLEDLTEAMDYDAVRVFSVADWIQIRYKYYNYEGAEEIENTLYRAVTERNIRIVYFKPFKFNEYKYVTDIKEYEKTFTSFSNRIKDHGMELGSFTNMEPIKLGFIKLNLIGFGVLGAGMILLNSLFNINKVIFNGLTLIGLFFVFLANFFTPSISDKVIALGASVIFPSLSILYLLEYCKDKLINRYRMDNIITMFKGIILTLIICTFISLLGGLYVGATLADIRYLLEMDIFRGVKISQMLPLVVFVIIYIAKYGYERGKEDIRSKDIGYNDYRRLMNQEIKVKQILVVSILLAIGYVYIARTGHETDIQPSDIEMIARNFLETVLIARPRTKEFLMAFPSLMMAVYVAFRGYKKLVFPFSLVAVIGFTSIANTFSHLRTPIYLSVIRTIYSIGLGALVGLMAIVLFALLERVFYSFERSRQ